ncbi:MULTISPECIES: DarT ssDNA thymidine ADP-ribosyltransferase family protein [Pseudomonas]|uniref:DarT ssDNA thymidine ADP-ribosyltransferase family protein n=1 Tax=Pseudomonas TaxID=286 RepID=UPI00293F47AD|nr:MULTISPECIES: DarT ssDNA thymidine ADP-ribosyltransferase family protein [Pseudomonas]
MRSSVAIRDQQFIYHLTSVHNVPSIMQRGLIPRAQLNGDFADIADPEIIEGRCSEALEQFVPFHWFARNPFDGRVHQDRPDESFVLIAVERSLARRCNWWVIPRHPLAGGAFELLDYERGFAAIDWDMMDRRDYRDPLCKHVCMAECLSPGPVPAAQFAKIYTPSAEIERTVLQAARQSGYSRLWVDSNPNMFPPR